MHLSVYRQGEIFYFAFVFGVLIGLYYDFYRLLRYLGFKSKAAVIAQDIIFMSTSAVMCFLFAQVTVNGHLRAFVAFAHLFGVISYRYSFGMLSGFVFKFIAGVLDFIKKLSEKFSNRILKITHRICEKLKALYSKIFKSFERKSKNLKKFETN